MNVEQRQVAADPQMRSSDLAYEFSFWLLSSSHIIAVLLLLGP